MSPPPTGAQGDPTSSTSTASSFLAGTARTSSTSSAWLTKSSMDKSSQRSTRRGVHFFSSGDGDEKQPSKARSFDMLSKRQRMKKQSLPQMRTSPSPISRVPSLPTTKHERSHSNSLDPGRLQPRGPTEREDYGYLRDFLKTNKAQPEDSSLAYAPKSHFDWDDSSDASSIHYRNTSDLRSFQRMAKRTKAITDSNVAREAPVSNVPGLPPCVDDWMKSAQMYARQKAEEYRSVASTSDATSPVRAIKRTSVLKMFNDPLWSEDKSGAIVNLCPTPPQSHSAKKAETTGSEDKGGSDVTALPQFYGAIAETPTTTSEAILRKPVSSSAGTGQQVVTKPSFASERMLARHPIISGMNAESEAENQHGRPRRRLPFSLRLAVPQVAPNPVLTTVSEPTTPSALTRSERSASSPLQQALQSLDERKVSDPFLDTARQQTAVSPPDRAHGLAVKDHDTYQDYGTPTRQEKRRKGAFTPQSSPSLREYFTPQSYHEDWRMSATPSPLRVSTESAQIRDKGYPKGPEDPDWDAAVKRVKKIVQDREKREAEEARQLEKQFDTKEKKIDRLRAGRDAIVRRSGHGWATKKPLEDITEDEFETVGAFYNSPELGTPSSSKSSVLGALFTRIRGSTKEIEERAELTRLQLERHRSLELLNSAIASQNFCASPKAAARLGISSTTDVGAESAALGLGISGFRGQSDLSRLTAGTSHNDESRMVDDDDRGSWCTESIYSIDVIEEAAKEELGVRNNIRSATDPIPQGRFFNSRSDREDHHFSHLADADAVPAPLNIPVLKVKSSKACLHPSSPNSFVPVRKASFHTQIQEVSEQQQAHIGSFDHPALRSPERPMLDSKGIIDSTEQNAISASRDSNLDSGHSSMSEQGAVRADEGYASGIPLQSVAEYSESRPKDQATPISTPKKNWQKTSPSKTRQADDEGIEDVDVQKLRVAVGLGPLRLACGANAPRHPHHPFTWDHRKVMCRQIHNPVEILSPSTTTGITDLEIRYGAEGSNETIESSKSCYNCGSLCCRFAEMMNTSKTRGSSDVVEEGVRVNAQQSVELLRSQHPNGVEDYETFLKCYQCERQVCPDCAKRCNQAICQAVVCNRCAKEDEECPVHN